MTKNNYELSRPVILDTIDRKGWKDSVIMDEAEGQALSKRFDLFDIESLKAEVVITPEQGGLVFHVTGHLQAKAIQKSIISGDAVPAELNQEIDAWYINQNRIALFDQERRNRNNDIKSQEREIQPEKEDPEPLYDGVLDVGETVAQFFGLALDDYPRTETETEGTGDYIEVKAEEAKQNPFAKLADLKKD